MSNNPIHTTGSVNVAELNNAIQETHIHIDLTKTFYSITPAEMQILEEGSASIWKDVTLTGIGIGIPCCINASIEYHKALLFNSEIFWNSLIGGICVVCAIIFGILWKKSTNNCKTLISDIKQRPKYKMP